MGPMVQATQGYNDKVTQWGAVQTCHRLTH